MPIEKAPTLTVQRSTLKDIKASGVLAQIGNAAIHLGSPIEGGGLNMLVIDDLKVFSDPEGSFVEVQRGEETILCSDGSRALCYPGDWSAPILKMYKDKGVAAKVKAAAPVVEVVEADAGPAPDINP
jgi:hypothetical protein